MLFGAIALALAAAPDAASGAPSNDNFATASTLTGSSIHESILTDGATKEVGEPNHAGGAGGAAGWWTGLYGRRS